MVLRKLVTMKNVEFYQIKNDISVKIYLSPYVEVSTYVRNLAQKYFGEFGLVSGALAMAEIDLVSHGGGMLDPARQTPGTTYFNRKMRAK